MVIFILPGKWRDLQWIMGNKCGPDKPRLGNLFKYLQYYLSVAEALRYIKAEFLRKFKGLFPVAEYTLISQPWRAVFKYSIPYCNSWPRRR